VVLLGAPEKLRARRRGLVPQLKAVEAAVGEAQHPWRQRAQQPAGERALVVCQRPDLDREQRVRAALAQPDQPQLRERRALLAARRARPPELLLAGGRVGEVQARPVDAHKPQIAVERALAPRLRQRHRDLLKQRPQRLRPQPRARLRQRPLGRHAPRPLPARLPRQPLHEHPHHLLVRGRAVQRQAEHVVDDDPRRQQPLPPLAAPRLGHHPIHQLGREHARQHADRDVIRQALTGLRLDPPGTRHARTVPARSDVI